MKKLTSRTFHRYLSVIVGIQILFWTISGLIFSWNSIEKVRGENLIRKPEPMNLAAFDLPSVNEVIEKNASEIGSANIVGAEIRMLLDRPVLELSLGEIKGHPARRIIFDAMLGDMLSPVSEALATKIAQADFAEDVIVKSAELMEGKLSSHSEIRGSELPVWRVVLDHPTGTVIYVSANRGVVTKRRNNRWRLFDFFWMLHTMDYQGRDNFNSWVLKSFSVLGVTTVVSGYWLWWRTSRIRRRRLKRIKGKPN